MINQRLSQLNGNRLGTFKAAPSSAWEQGMVATIGPTGLTVAGTTGWPFGIFMGNHQNAMTRAIYGEIYGPIDYSGVGGATPSVTLTHSNLVAGAYIVFAGSTVLTPGTDYTLNTSTGILTAVASGRLDSHSASYANGGMISINYRYNMTVAELNGFLDNKGQVIGGPGMANNFDEVLVSGETTVAFDGNIIYTDQYDTSINWTSALNAQLFSNANSQLTTVNTGGQIQVGRVIALPTATQPWLGIVITGR
jgi:hypothetical protein